MRVASRRTELPELFAADPRYTGTSARAKCSESYRRASRDAAHAGRARAAKETVMVTADEIAYTIQRAREARELAERVRATAVRARERAAKVAMLSAATTMKLFPRSEAPSAGQPKTSTAR